MGPASLIGACGPICFFRGLRLLIICQSNCIFGIDAKFWTHNIDFMKYFLLVFTALFFAGSIVFGQDTLNLYGGAPPGRRQAENQEYVENNEVYHKVSEPKLIVYPAPPDKANGTGVIICPGGGYEGLWMVHEGSSVAERLNALGITAFILKYRMPDDRTMVNKAFGPLEDAQRAIQLVRQNAGKWKVKVGKIGVIGFSAGGHLASSLGTHFDSAVIVNTRHTDLRPDFMILVYPVISMQKGITHMGSRNALLGTAPTQQLVDYFSNDQRVTDNTPPTLLLQATDDALVPVENSLLFYQALLKHHVSVAMHLFDKGGHGFGLEPAKSNWFGYAADWLRFKGWVN